MLNIRLIFHLSLSLAALCPLAWSQAVIDESQETVTLYVDSVNGSDSNPGTQQLPYKTIAKGVSTATSNNQAGIGTKVLVNPGTYRESVSMMHSNKSTSLPITIQAAQTGTAIMSGADILTGWKQSGGNTKVYTNTWSYDWGLCDTDGGLAPPEEDIVRRREMIVVNGVVMTQVLSGAAMKSPGTFYVDESKNTVYLWPPTGTNMNTATIEVPSRDRLFTIEYTGNIVLRGLTFQHANSCRGDAAVSVQFSADNVLFDSDAFYWNNAAGLRILFTTDTTVQNSTANHNGTSGMKGYETKNDLWQNIQTRYNGWRGAQGVYYEWGEGGVHFGLAHDQTLQSIDSDFNQTHGIHWDTDSENVTLDSSTFSQNQLAAGFTEKVQGPITITNTNFCNGNPSMGPNNVGFELRYSENVTISSSQIYNNSQNLILVGYAGGTKINNWETGQQYTLFTSDTSFTNNVVVGTSQNTVFYDGSLAGADWTLFQTTLNSDNNTWWNATNSKPFLVPVPKFYTALDLPGWQLTTLQDTHSSFSAPSDGGSGCVVTPTTPEYWFILDAFKGYQTVSAGGSAVFTVNVIPVGAYTGTLSLTSDGVQKIQGASGTWSSSKITNSGTQTFTVATTSSTPKGAYPITLEAFDGVSTKTMTVTVTVN